MSKFHLCLVDDDGDDKLNINKAYAERYDSWRHLEELQKLKDRYGGGTGDDDSTNSSSSEEPAVWSMEHEKDFLRTLSALKTRDPRLYSGQKFFTAEDKGTSTNNIVKFKKKDAPMFLKDYERKLILEKGGDITEDEEEKKTYKPGYYEEQELIRRELKAALAEQNDDTEPLLRQRVKTKDEVKNEEDQYYEWLKGQRDEDLPGVEELKGLKEVWNDMNLDESEEFLRDYLLDKKYEDDNGVPSYEEIVNVEKDEEELERENEFERKYNFRYEEPDQDFLKHYPRTVKQSLRKKDERRKQKRDAYKERKKLEKQTRKNEIKELRALKKKEIEEKLKKLKILAGDDGLPLNVDDLEADFDPAAYDKRMKEVFNSQYYEKTMEASEEKPVFSDTSDISTDDSDYDTFEVNKEEKEKEIENTSSDCGACNPEKKRSRKKRKRNSRFLKAVLKKKPLFNPEEKSFEEYFNEYYALEYEDIIGDGLITKFKYRNVPANDFGITIDELLSADDRQLNAWVSLKKVTAYRSETEELYDIKAYKKKALNFLRKKKIFSTDFGGKNSKELAENNNDANDMEHMCQVDKAPIKKKMRTKKNSQKFPEDVKSSEQEQNSTLAQQKIRLVKRLKNAPSRKKNHSTFEQFTSTVDVDDDRLRAYGINPRKYKNKLFHQENCARESVKRHQ
ncbi:unnamed protein product [Cercopithifilaria johnstoni]|uniref:Protein KRI1 homolog n=1 Tax=Cercopithifilaria johnstoni TaxID=2874296 RepID=A0A8J2Q4G0_9BILA|nr:unnamed protein product [Cercopithifilaria johnstoni]